MSKKILYFLLMMSVFISITACSSSPVAKIDAKTANDVRDAYSKAAKMIGVEAPSMSSKKNAIASVLMKDSIGSPKSHAMPSSCVSSDEDVIGRGKFLFENSRGKGVKKPKYGYARKMKKSDAGYVAERQKWKPYANCVACHDTTGIKAPGDIGPSLVGYKANFLDTKVRTTAWVFEKISDPRVDNPNTVMTVNHTTFSSSEICAIMSFVISNK